MLHLISLSSAYSCTFILCNLFTVITTLINVDGQSVGIEPADHQKRQSVHNYNNNNNNVDIVEAKDSLDYYFNDLNFFLANPTSMDNLLMYEKQLQNMLQLVRNQMENVLNEEVEANNVEQQEQRSNRLIREVGNEIELSTADSIISISGSTPPTSTNSTITAVVNNSTTFTTNFTPVDAHQNITVTSNPIVFRLFNLIAGHLQNLTTYNGNATLTSSGFGLVDNETTIATTTADPAEITKVTTSASAIPKTMTPKQSQMADKPQINPSEPQTSSPFLDPFRNGRHSGLGDLLINVTKCTQLTEEQLVKELKQQGTYNPDFMAWDVKGVLNFFEKASTDSYDKVKKVEDRSRIAEQNLAAIEALVKELNLKNCNLRAPDVLARLYNFSAPRSAFDQDSDRLRTKRAAGNPSASVENDAQTIDDYESRTRYLYDLYSNSYKDDSSASGQQQQQPSPPSSSSSSSSAKKEKSKSQDDEDIIGQVHVVPFGCRKRGTAEDGYLRLCGACQAIRRLPDNFFPPFINEVTCDEDKACLYFYDYPHGKCKQKHLNFVVLQNIGTSDCQLWRRFNLNVRVSCECFVDEMSFFAKYV